MKPAFLAPALAALVLGLLALAAATGPSTAQPAGAPRLSLPIACEPGRTCEVQHYNDRDPGPGTRDYRCGLQTYEKHNGVDIRVADMAAQRRGVAVLAAAPGTVTRLRDGVADVPVRTPADVAALAASKTECGNGVVVDHGNGWETQYCHMARGSISVKQGDAVQAGTPVGKVGLSGNTEYPHLHFTVRKGSEIVDPFGPDMSKACGAQAPLWTAAALAKMPYHSGAVLNVGFTDRQMGMAEVEAGNLPPATAASPWLIAYARGIALQPGDEIELDLKGPDGASLARARNPPLERWRAQDMRLVGKRRPPSGWPPGVYTADYRVWRSGKVAISRRFTIRL